MINGGEKEKRKKKKLNTSLIIIDAGREEPEGQVAWKRQPEPRTIIEKEQGGIHRGETDIFQGSLKADESEGLDLLSKKEKPQASGQGKF